MSLQWVIQPKPWWLGESQVYNMVLLILLGVSTMFSLECLVQWMMLKYYVFSVCTKKPSIMDLFYLNFDEQGINWWQRLSFAFMVDDSKTTWQCSTYHHGSIIQQTYRLRKKHCEKCIWDFKFQKFI